MTFRFLLVIALGWLGALTLRASSLADVDADNGLPDARLGTQLGAFTGLQKTEDTGRWLTYTRPSDKLVFERIKLNGITYNFFKERLYSIDLDLEGSGNVRAMLKWLQRRYGKETSFETKEYPHTTATMEVREWAGAKAYCVYKSAGDRSGAQLVYVDRPTWDMLQVPREQQAAQARALLQGSFIKGDF